MPEIGYALSSEEHPPNDLVRHARLAEEAGFSFALVSDHFHPWIDNQGESPFVWGVLGGIAQATGSVRVGTGVTCPLIRMHPAIVAHAAASKAAMMPGRFFLGVGTGENLNEHVLGDRWPTGEERVVDVVRLFESSGGKGKPKIGMAHVCWAESEEKARRTAYAIWPNSAIEGALGQELPLPEHFEQAAVNVTEDDVAEQIVCGPDPDRHLDEIRAFADAGFDHVYVHQIGPEQEGSCASTRRRSCRASSEGIRRRSRLVLPRDARVDVRSSALRGRRPGLCGLRFER